MVHFLCVQSVCASVSPATIDFRRQSLHMRVRVHTYLGLSVGLSVCISTLFPSLN
jgi:hypothetical protein